MPDVAAFEQKDDFFRDVRRVIRNSFDPFGDLDQMQRPRDVGRILDHVTGQFALDLFVEGINVLVARDDFAGPVRLFVHEGVQR